MSDTELYSRDRRVSPMPCYQGPPCSGEILTGTLLSAFGEQPPGEDFASLMAALHRIDPSEMSSA